MTERDALLAAVCARPAEDVPRLVFADWLDEHDEPDRAELVRLQIAIPRMRNGKGKRAAQAREAELLAAHGRQWAAPLLRFTHSKRFEPIYGPAYEFRRGFVEVVCVEPNTFMEAIDDLFELTPLRGLHFIDAGGFDWVAGCERMLRITELDLSGCVLSDAGSDAPALLRSKYLANLVSLNASGCDDNGHLDARGLTALAGTRHLARLERLDIGDNWMFGNDDAPAREVTACRKLLWRLGAKMPALRELRLAGMGLRDGEVSALTAQPWVSQLRKLDLSANELDHFGVVALCESKYLKGLEELDLSENLVADESRPADEPFRPEDRRALKARFGARVRL